VITDPWFYAAAVPAVLLAGISKGGFGHGAGMFATPLLALSVPIPQAAAILLPPLIAMDLAGVWAYRHTFSREHLRLFLVGGLAGVALGALCFGLFDEAVVRILLGAISIGFVMNRYLRRDAAQPAPRSVPKALFWSTISGVTTTLAHAGGPPLSVYLLPQRLEKAVMVGTTVILFAVLNAVKVIPYAWLGLFRGDTLYTSFVLVPLAPVGIALGVVLMRRLPQETFYRVCYALLLVVGAKLLWDGVARLA
jgi:uncharacterized protein